MRLFLLSLLLICCTALAAPRPPAVANYTHRVVGLFDAAREEEFRAAVAKVPDVKLVSIDFDFAEATFSYDPATIKGPKKLSAVDRLNDELKVASNHTFGVREQMTTPRESLQRVEIPIKGLDCRGCSFAAYRSIMDLDGVAQATSSFKDGHVSALIDPAKTNRAALVTALKRAGATVSEQP